MIMAKIISNKLNRLIKEMAKNHNHQFNLILNAAVLNTVAPFLTVGDHENFKLASNVVATKLPQFTKKRDRALIARFQDEVGNEITEKNEGKVRQSLQAISTNIRGSKKFSDLLEEEGNKTYLKNLYMCLMSDNQEVKDEAAKCFLSLVHMGKDMWGILVNKFTNKELWSLFVRSCFLEEDKKEFLCKLFATKKASEMEGYFQDYPTLSRLRSNFKKGKDDHLRPLHTKAIINLVESKRKIGLGTLSPYFSESLKQIFEKEGESKVEKIINILVVNYRISEEGQHVDFFKKWFSKIKSNDLSTLRMKSAFALKYFSGKNFSMPLLKDTGLFEEMQNSKNEHVHVEFKQLVLVLVKKQSKRDKIIESIGDINEIVLNMSDTEMLLDCLFNMVHEKTLHQHGVGLVNIKKMVSKNIKSLNKNTKLTEKLLQLIEESKDNKNRLETILRISVKLNKNNDAPIVGQLTRLPLELFSLCRDKLQKIYPVTGDFKSGRSVEFKEEKNEIETMKLEIDTLFYIKLAQLEHFKAVLENPDNSDKKKQLENFVNNADEKTKECIYFYIKCKKIEITLSYLAVGVMQCDSLHKLFLQDSEYKKQVVGIIDKDKDEHKLQALILLNMACDKGRLPSNEIITTFFEGMTRKDVINMLTVKSAMTNNILLIREIRKMLESIESNEAREADAVSSTQKTPPDAKRMRFDPDEFLATDTWMLPSLAEIDKESGAGAGSGAV